MQVCTFLGQGTSGVVFLHHWEYMSSKNELEGEKSMKITICNKTVLDLDTHEIKEKEIYPWKVDG